MNQLILDLALPLSPTFENFLIGNNQEGVDVLLAEAGERFIYLWGAPGCGKTHLLRSWVSRAKHLGYTAIYLDGKSMPELAHEASVIAVDHLDRLPQEDQIALFSTYNALRENGVGRLLMAGRYPPAVLEVRADLRSRLSWGLVLEIKTLSDQDKLEVLRRYVTSRQLVLADEVLQYMLTHSRRDLSSLIQMIDTLDRQSLALRRPITIPLLKTIL